jgi:hypothetical protein
VSDLRPLRGSGGGPQGTRPTDSRADLLVASVPAIRPGFEQARLRLVR